MFLHAVEAISDLMLARHEKRASPFEDDADLHGREPPWPAEDNPADRTRDAAVLKDEDVNSRNAADFIF